MRTDAFFNPLAQGQPSPFDPEGSFALRYARLRRVKEQPGAPQ